MESPVIVGGVRTPFVKAAGAFNYVPAQELGRLVVRELLERLNLDPDAIDEVITGNVAPSDAANVSRVIALRAGIPIDRVAHTVNRNCASGLEAVTQAYERIRDGPGPGGDRRRRRLDEQHPRPLDQIAHRRFFGVEHGENRLEESCRRWLAIRPRDLAPVIGIKQGLTDPVSGMMMGDTAEKLAREYGISREAQDLFALRSHQRATAAWNEGRLQDEVMTVYPEPSRQARRRATSARGRTRSLEALAKLKPFFDRRWGTVTVGQLLPGDRRGRRPVAHERRAGPLARVCRGWVEFAATPTPAATRRVMGLGPVYSTQSRLASDGRPDEPARTRSRSTRPSPRRFWPA